MILKSVFLIAIMAVAMIGTIIIQEVHASEEGIEEVTPLTINSLEIYEDADYTRYRVTGDAPASTEITFKTTKPDGSPGNYPGSVDTGKPAYIVDNKIHFTNNLVYGNWTLEVCAPEYDVCVQESFTINEPVTLSAKIDTLQTTIGEPVFYNISINHPDTNLIDFPSINSNAKFSP